MLMNFVIAHKDYFLGLATGYALEHVPQAVAFLFHQAMRWPWLRGAILKDPARAKALVDSIRDELDKDIDAEAQAAKKPSPPTSPPPAM